MLKTIFNKKTTGFCSMGLSTHVLDTAQGQPASGVHVALYRLDDAAELLLETRTNADGRTDRPLLEDHQAAAGRYQLRFKVADYFHRCGLPMDDPPFVDEVVLNFAIANPQQHYHVPLLVSPWSYSTYRGS